MTPEIKGPRPSLALYLTAGLAQFCGLMVVRYQISDPGFVYFLIALTALGLGVAYYLRQRGVSPRIVPIGALVGGVFFLIALGSGALLSHLFPSQSFVGTELSVIVALAATASVSNFLAVSDDAVVFTTVWVVAIIGLSGAVDLNRELILFFFLFLLLFAFLLIHQNYLAQARSTKETSDVPLRSLQIQGVTALVAWLTVGVAGTLLAIPLRALGKGISLRQVVNQLQLPPSALLEGRRTTTGSNQLAFDNRTEFRVGLGPTGDDQTEVLTVESPRPHYWRGRAYITYGAQGWTNPDTPPIPVLPESGAVQPMVYRIRSSSRVRPARFLAETHRFKPVGALFGPVYHAAEPVQVRGMFEQLVRRTDDTLGGSRGSGGSYEVDSEICDADPQMLNRSPETYPAAIRNRYLWSGEINPRLTRLLTEATKNARGPYEKAEAIRQFVQDRCTYSLSARAVPTGQDPASFFLLDSREGYCDLFATATTVLCRLAGLPARVVTGFNSGMVDPANPNLYHLKNSNRHAWTEVYFSGYGWVPFDATVASATPAQAPTPTEPLRKRSWSERLLALLPGALLALGSLGILYVTLNELRRQAQLRKISLQAIAPQQRQIDRAYRSALSLARRAAVPREAPMTSQEHVARVEETLGSEVAGALAPLAQLADRALFDPITPTTDEQQAAESHLARFRTALKESKGKK
jgi:transglutaminase-like putative cysteine protease